MSPFDFLKSINDTKINLIDQDEENTKYYNVPNKKEGGFCFGGKIAPIFFNTLEDSGAFPIELDVSNMEMGQEIILEPFNGKVLDANSNEVISTFELKTPVLLDEVRANGRIPLIIGRQLTDKTRDALDLEPTDIFTRPDSEDASDKGYTLAQKMVGKACGVEGIRPGTYCEPRMTTVGSQDTTGPMTRDELKELACLGFSADLVMQSFCHTAHNIGNSHQLLSPNHCSSKPTGRCIPQFRAHCISPHGPCLSDNSPDNRRKLQGNRKNRFPGSLQDQSCKPLHLCIQVARIPIQSRSFQPRQTHLAQAHDKSHQVEIPH